MCLRCADRLSEGFGVLAQAPSGKRDFQAMQEAFNRWEEQSGLDLTSPGNTTPSAIPLFATGLGAFGLLGWRRKRKNDLAAA